MVLCRAGRREKVHAFGPKVLVCGGAGAAVAENNDGFDVVFVVVVVVVVVWSCVAVVAV